MNNIIIKIENGSVAEVYCTEDVNVIVVDRDLLRGGATLEERVRTAVILTVEQRIRPEDLGRAVKELVLERGKPAHRRPWERLVTAAGTTPRF